MNRQTTPNAIHAFVSKRPSRRIAAAFGASAALSLTLIGPAVSSQPIDPPPSSASAQCENYVGAGTVSPCTKSSADGGSGAASSNAAAQGLPAPAPAVAPKLMVGSTEPVELPVPAIGAAAAVVVAGGLMIASVHRRRTA